MPERDRQLVGVQLQLFGEKLEQLLEGGREIAILVERIDQRGDDLPIAQRQVEQRQLRVEVVAQRAGSHLLRQKGVVIVVAAGGSRTPVAVGAADDVRFGRGGAVERLVGFR